VQHSERSAVEAHAAAAHPRAVGAFSIALGAGAVVVAVVVAAIGAERPAWGAVLLLAVAAALCVNRFALFPSEHAATAEAAVLLAAVVGFRDDAVVLGPLVVALLVGPLDALHWEQRAFVRMAYNAGNRAWATLAAAVAFTGVHDAVGRSTAGWVVVVLAACVAFTVVDVGLSIVLLRMHGVSWREATEHLLAVDVLTLPVAAVGAAAGFLATEVGWWATVAVLLPAAFLPELVIARARVRAMAVRDLAALLTVIALLATVALVTPVATTATLALLAGIAVAAGIELVLERRGLIPPMVATVVAAGIVVGGERIVLAPVLAAVVATVTSWWCGTQPLRSRFLLAVTLATATAWLAGAVALGLPRSSSTAALGALAAAVVFASVASVASPARKRLTRALPWAVPAVAAACAWAGAWSELGPGGALLFAGAMVALVVGVAAWGSPPWRSRLAPHVAPPRRLLAPTAVVAACVVGLAIATVLVHDAAAVRECAWIGAGLGELVAAMAASAVRQWRLAPGPRALGLLTSLASAVALLALVPWAIDHRPWVWPVIVTALMAALLLTVRGPARPAARVGAARERGARAP